MGNRRGAILCAALALLVPALCSACAGSVTLYTDCDRAAVQRLVAPFASRTGLSVNVVSFGDPRNLVSSINEPAVEGKPAPTQNAFYSVADVVLSADKDTGEALMARDAVAAWNPAAAAQIPAGAKHDGWWYGVSGRAWVLAWNTALVKQPPAGLLDLADKAYPRGSVAMINPNYILYYPCGAAAILGADKMNAFLQALIDRDAQWMGNPAETAELVASGNAAVCLTSLADALKQKAAGAPVEWAVPDQGEGQIGAFLKYNVVCVTSVTTIPDRAKQLANYLLEPDTERLCVELGLGDATLRPCGSAAPVVKPLATNLYDAQDAMQNRIGMMLIRFTSVNPEYKGK